MSVPEREIRADYNETSITVYQAYSDQIAESALENQTFVSPPFSMNRMTWIKPSFLWMMYRSGWGKKDDGQKRILAIDITHEGFAWALAHACPSHPESGMDHEEWRKALQSAPVRVQWDPERDLHHAPLRHRAIQIGLSGEAVELYVKQWIKRVSDVTRWAAEIHERILRGALEEARMMLPREKPYTVGMNRELYLAIELEQLIDPTHFRHEEILSNLDPAVENVYYLKQAIILKPKLRYLDYDDYGAFYKKCLWALQHIGTTAAITVIEECSQSDDTALRDQALYRLKRIAEGSPVGKGLAQGEVLNR